MKSQVFKAGRHTISAHMEVSLDLRARSGEATDSRNYTAELAIPDSLRDLITTICEDIERELDSQLRNESDWISLLSKIDDSQLRSWAASIVWWNYIGSDKGPLFDLMMEYDYKHDLTISDLASALRSIGCSSIVCKQAPAIFKNAEACIKVELEKRKRDASKVIGSEIAMDIQEVCHDTATPTH